jgi:hypothetical protein
MTDFATKIDLRIILFDSFGDSLQHWSLGQKDSGSTCQPRIQPDVHASSLLTESSVTAGCLQS